MQNSSLLFKRSARRLVQLSINILLIHYLLPLNLALSVKQGTGKLCGLSHLPICFNEKDNRPTHKSGCEITADQKLHTITDLLNLFLGNKFLHSYLELALILELGLEPMAVLDQLFTAQFYIGIEPCDINDFQRLWSPEFDFDPSKKVKMKGMFQLLGLTTSSTHPHDVPSARSRLTPDFADIRRQVDERGHEGDTLVQCEFVAMTDGTVSNQICVLSINLGAFVLAKQLEKITVSKGIDKPLTVATCLE